MNKINKLFKELTNKKAIISLKYNRGITNKNHMVYSSSGRYVLRVPRNDMLGIDFVNQSKVLNKVKDINVNVEAYDKEKGLLVSKYVKHNKKKITINEMVSLLHILHSKNTEGIGYFDPFKLLNTYKEYLNETLFTYEENIVNKAKELYNKYPLVLCHNDVILANFFKGKDNKNYLIDYEYAGLNIELFDVASFLSENDLTNKEKDEFIKAYFDNVDSDLINDINTMINFLDVLWSSWAKAMYVKYKEEVFNDIYKIKTTRKN